MQKIKELFKNETVLCIALILAVLSTFVVVPDAGYMDYIDFKTLAILFCLMCVMAGLQKLGVFKYIAEALLMKVKNETSLIMIPVLLCFFFSMIITNDVALITFVPFTLTIFDLFDEKKFDILLIKIIAMQTLAANLGSMLTPIGNPQNLYLYGKSGLSITDFIILTLPYALTAFVLIVAWCIYQGKKIKPKNEVTSINLTLDRTDLSGKGKYIAIYCILFVICLMTVAHLIPYWLMLVIVAAVILVMDKAVLAKADYSLLLTFVGFFVFIGNMGRTQVFKNILEGIVSGNEVITSVISSQVISNVPAALLLSGFTEDYRSLIIGVNIGGLGTLIASMASLISYKYVVRERESSKGQYFKYFTVANICFLIVMLFFYYIIG